NDAHDGYNCPSQVPSIQTLPSFLQQYLCCEDWGDTHETFQCQLMNYFKSNQCYDYNYSGFDQIEPPHYFVNPSLNIQNEPDDHELFISKLIQQKLQNEYGEPFSAIAIKFYLPTVETKDSLRMGDENLDTIPETESDEFIKSNVENLVQNPSESADLSDSECDVPACDDFTTFSNLLFDADDDFSSNVSRVNVNSSDSSSKTDDRIDKLADQISKLVEIVNKQVITPATAKAVEKTCVICEGAHAYYDCIATNINQPSVCMETSTYNQVSPPNRASNQIPPPGFAPVQNNQNKYNQN
nr:hypothetical protein [Tanacetum cinerariifolium]